MCVLLLVSGALRADGWTNVSSVNALRVRSDGAILVQTAPDWGFTPTCATTTRWLIIGVSTPQRDEMYDALLATWRNGGVRFWWIDRCAELVPDGGLAQLVTMAEFQ